MEAEIRNTIDQYFKAWREEDATGMVKSQLRLEAMGFVVMTDARRRAISARLLA